MERLWTSLLKMKRWLRVLLLRAAAVGVLAFAVQFAFNSDTRARSDYLDDEVERMRELNDELAAENEQLRLQIDGLRHDDRYLEQVARQEFGMIRRGEVLYKFPDYTDDTP